MHYLSKLHGHAEHVARLMVGGVHIYRMLRIITISRDRMNHTA
jgi:hypothetical protein